MDSSSQKLDQHLARVLESDVRGLDACRPPKSLPVYVSACPGTAGAEKHLSRAGVSKLDEVFDGSHSERGGHYQRLGRKPYTSDADEVI
jgi:hypothetical protein